MQSVFGDGVFNETIRACHLVYNLQCPADALFLLHPVDKTIPESVSAWSVASAHSDAYWILPVRRDLMISAIRVFLPTGPVYDWLHSSDFTAKRSMRQWVDFAHSFMENHRFTARWWREHEWWECETMGVAIMKKYEEEKQRLKNSLWRDECRKMMKEKMDRQALKEAAKAEEEEQFRMEVEEEIKKLTEAQIRAIQAANQKSQGKGATKSEAKKKPQVLRLSADEIARAKAIADQLFIKHNSMIKLVKTILNERIETFSFEANFPKIARLIVTLANKEYRKIRWALKVEVHRAAEDRLGYETWFVERELGRQAFNPAPNPLDALRELR